MEFLGNSESQTTKVEYHVHFYTVASNYLQGARPPPRIAKGDELVASRRLAVGRGKWVEVTVHF